MDLSRFPIRSLLHCIFTNNGMQTTCAPLRLVIYCHLLISIQLFMPMLSFADSIQFEKRQIMLETIRILDISMENQSTLIIIKSIKNNSSMVLSYQSCLYILKNLLATFSHFFMENQQLIFRFCIFCTDSFKQSLKNEKSRSTVARTCLFWQN